MLEISDADAMQRWLDHGVGRPPAAVRAVDLASLEDRLLSHAEYHHCLFLGCELSSYASSCLVAAGATVIGDLGVHHFAIHRNRLYTPEELFADTTTGEMTDDYARTFDAAVHAEFVASGGPRPPSIRVSLARRLHDHSITEAFEEHVDGRRVVAIMGGHGMERASDEYEAVARLSRTLTRLDFTMVSGGGPGAMEATHLGAWFATRPDRDLDDARREVLSPRPPGAPRGLEFDDEDWLARAMQVRRRWPIPDGDLDRCTSIGIPTWLFGHEPPAPFATRIAKYFANAVREEGLLSVATNGVVFAPGAAGTVQELFQDAAQNHYETMGFPSPMVLFGVDKWTRQIPVMDVLDRLGEGRPWRDLIHLTDDADEVVEILTSFSAPGPPGSSATS